MISYEVYTGAMRVIRALRTAGVDHDNGAIFIYATHKEEHHFQLYLAGILGSYLLVQVPSYMPLEGALSAALLEHPWVHAWALFVPAGRISDVPEDSSGDAAVRVRGAIPEPVRLIAEGGGCGPSGGARAC